jgi:hypothetical protein
MKSSLFCVASRKNAYYFYIIKQNKSFHTASNRKCEDRTIVGGLEDETGLN